MAWLGFKGGSPNYVRTSSDFRLEQASLVSKSEEQRDQSRNFSVHISVGLFSDFFSQKKQGDRKADASTLLVTVRRKSTWYWKSVGGWENKPSRRSLSVESNPRQATPTTPQAKPSEKRQPTSPLTILLSLCDKSIIEQPKSKKTSHH